MLIGRLCHASILLISASVSVVGIESLIDVNHLIVGPWAHEDEIPHNYENRSKSSVLGPVSRKFRNFMGHNSLCI